MSTRVNRTRHPAVLQTRHESVFVHQPRSRVRLSEIIGPLTYALDLAEGLPAGHNLRTCWIGMHIGDRIGLDSEKLSNLYYTLLLKDIGGSGIANRVCALFANDDLKVKSQYRYVDSQSQWQIARFLWRHYAPRAPLPVRFGKILLFAIRGRRIRRDLISIRSQRAVALAARMGFEFEVADGIRCIDEHYNGRGDPEQKRGREIPIFSRIALLAQVFELFSSTGGVDAALRQVRQRRGTWFDPQLVDVLKTLAAEPAFCEPLRSGDIQHLVHNLEPCEHVLLVNEQRLDEIVRVFADVIDAKSPYSRGRASRVAHYAQMIATQLALPDDDIRLLYRAGLLQDIGNLGISNLILDKPSRLTPEEWEYVKLHPVVSEQILKRVENFSEIAFLAGSHHERLDGRGYPRGLKGDDIPPHARILTLAGAFDAISYPQAYHPTRTCQEALAILEEERDLVVDGACLDALRHAVHNESASIELLQTA
jgi:HD-GYP domain-containing protein (c-di-GMP phosphodiesterase class II)